MALDNYKQTLENCRIKLLEIIDDSEGWEHCQTSVNTSLCTPCTVCNIKIIIRIKIYVSIYKKSYDTI